MPTSLLVLALVPWAILIVALSLKNLPNDRQWLSGRFGTRR